VLAARRPGRCTKGHAVSATTGEWTPEAIAAKRQAKRAAKAAAAEIAAVIAEADAVVAKPRKRGRPRKNANGQAIT
jgi:hypothetical protein